MQHFKKLIGEIRTAQQRDIEFCAILNNIYHRYHLINDLFGEQYDRHTEYAFKMMPFLLPVRNKLQPLLNTGVFSVRQKQMISEVLRALHSPEYDGESPEIRIHGICALHFWMGIFNIDKGWYLCDFKTTFKSLTKDDDGVSFLPYDASQKKINAAQPFVNPNKKDENFEALIVYLNQAIEYILKEA
mgnify:FL=1